MRLSGAPFNQSIDNFAFVGTTLCWNVICYWEMAPKYKQLPTMYGSVRLYAGVKGIYQGRL